VQTVVVDLAGVHMSNLGQLHPTCSRAPVNSLRAWSCSPTDLPRKLGICEEDSYNGYADWYEQIMHRSIVGFKIINLSLFLAPLGLYIEKDLKDTRSF
jgi:hypothetical protein